MKWANDRKVLSDHPCDPEGSALVDAPAADGLHKTLDNRCRRWSDKGVLGSTYLNQPRNF